MKRQYRMKFGASVTGNATRFRLWAPEAESVGLRLDASAADLAMERDAEDWFELAVPDTKAGQLYQFVINGGLAVPDPASRFQPYDVGGPSEVIDAASFDWTDDDWQGRPWHEAVLYELHLGAWTQQGGFAGAKDELERLARLGITAIELMPLADFAGKRNWGYDGVLPFAPDSSYGRPEDLKSLVCEAHRQGLMVFIDVVYNHFGPDGNYLPLYAPDFFSRRNTDWGQAIDFAGKAREFFIDNALYWLEEYHVDGLRFDAVHAISDESRPPFLEELAITARDRIRSRHIHLVLENDDNAAHYLARRAEGSAIFYDAQWNDDFHHVMHVILTGETAGYYADYADAPVDRLGRALTEGFIYQGDHSPYRAKARGAPSAHLPPLAFVNFIQNHDQIGNRAFGERLTQLAPAKALEAATAILLLAPSPPLLFMGEELGTDHPFLFFCDFTGSLADAVREGRRREFARFPGFASEQARSQIPDPLAPETFERSRIAGALRTPASGIVALYAELLATRRRDVVPRLKGPRDFAAAYQVRDKLLSVLWHLPDGSRLGLTANLSHHPAAAPERPAGRCLWGPAIEGAELPPWGVLWTLASGA